MVFLFKKCFDFLRGSIQVKYLLNLPGGCVGAGGGFGGLLPNVVNAVELTPNKIIKTVNSMVKLPHCVNRFNGSIFIILLNLVERNRGCSRHVSLQLRPPRPDCIVVRARR